jgi:predicted enzyme related to lactoylglutathione lyase
MEKKEQKVTGIGGVFFKSENPKATKEWYATHLGLPTDEYGTQFQSRNINKPEEVNMLKWSPFNANTDYFNPSEKEFVINYRVENIHGFVEKLKSEGVTVLDEIETFSYGSFVHIMDSDGNKIEL